MTRRSGGVSAAAWLTLGFISGVLASVGGWLVLELLRPPQPPAPAPTPFAIPSAPPCSPPPTPPPTAEPTPTPEASPSSRAMPKAPALRPTPAPGPATPHPEIPRRLGEADQAAAEGRLEAALEGYEQVLQLDPGNARAQGGKARVAAPLLALKRSFVEELTEADGGGVGRGLSGFEPGDVVVKRAPQVPARLEFEMHPAHVKPGDAYTVTLYLANAGKKSVRIRSLRLVQSANGARSPSEPLAQVREVRRGERAQLAVLTGAWSATRAWSCEATVIAENGDVYGRRLVWR